MRQRPFVTVLVEVRNMRAAVDTEIVSLVTSFSTSSAPLCSVRSLPQN